MLRLCVHAHATDWPSRVICGLGLFGGQPAVSLCKTCERREPPAEIRPTGPDIVRRPRPQDELPADADAAQVQVLNAAGEVTSAQRSLVELRVATCNLCQYKRGFNHLAGEVATRTVSCGLCGCDGISILHGTCPGNKWQGGPSQSSAVHEIAADAGGKQAQKLLIRCTLSPGDVVTLTAAIRDLHRHYPGRYRTAVQTTAQELWESNPHITQFEAGESDVREIPMHYPLINQSNQRPVHFLHGYADYLSSQLNVPLPLLQFRGDVHLSEEEKSWTTQVEQEFGYKGRYWVVMAGGKYDFTAKWWAPQFYQDVVDHFLGKIQFVQCGEANHWHPRLKNTFDLIGKTNIRQFVRLIYHSHGVLCPVTFAMHLAAAVPIREGRIKPCVVVAGGREPAHWESYPGHQFLNTIGQLPCCAMGGCWRSRCQLVNDGDSKDRENMCERPVPVGLDLRIPQCMMLIKPSLVIDAIERSQAYYH